MDESINFSLKDSKVKVTERSKGRMRIDIKLNAEYATGFRNFVKTFKPDEIDEGEFYRQLMFKGVNAHIADVQAFAQEQREAAAKAEEEKDNTVPLEDLKKEIENSDDAKTEA